MVPKDQCEHIKQYCIDRNNTWSKPKPSVMRGRLGRHSSI